MFKFLKNGEKKKLPKIKLLKAITPALWVAESSMEFRALYMKCRIKKMSNLNLDLSISLKVNNINLRVAWLNIKKSNKSNCKNKKVMMTKLYMRVLIFRLILNN